MNDLSGIVREELGKLARYEIPHPEGITARLDANESPYGLSDELRAELGRRLAAIDLHRYPDGNASELRAAVARYAGVDGKQIVFGNGSDELIALMCQAYGRPRLGAPDGRARIAYPWPSFIVYRLASMSIGQLPVEIPLDEEFQLSARAVDKAFHPVKPNVVFFARPNNPTGTLWSRELIVNVAQEFPDVLVVCDEAYVDYSGDSLLNEQVRLPNLVIMRTFSKIGLAALRCGFLIADPRVVHELEKIRLPYNLSTLDQAAAAWLVGQHPSLLKEHVATVVSERERLFAALSQSSRVSKVWPSHANLVCFRVGAPGDGAASKLWAQLAARGVLVRNLDKPGPLSGCLRVTVGTPAENDAFLAALNA